jgi:Spy/CpxP family protein refolding chaperone
MTKIIAVLAAGLLATGSLFAGQKGDCNMQAANHGKMACEISMKNLDLTPAQKSKMGALMAEHQKEGCSKATESKYMKEAKGVLTKEQYAKFKAECNAACEKEGAKA